MAGLKESEKNSTSCRIQRYSVKTYGKSAFKFVNLKFSDYNVSEQPPPPTFETEVKERWNALIPELIKARYKGKGAVLMWNKLFIDNKLYDPHPR